MSGNNNNNNNNSNPPPPPGAFSGQQIQNLFSQAMQSTGPNAGGTGLGFGSSVHEDARRQGFQMGASQDPVSQVSVRRQDPTPQ
ncbi:hypothetical protein PG997_011446 [Apiospora hydei]|uniref:Uncharacterized protein n=1 Tax=Apiospora hydei TaxID=1337664 RepID=A0ABR1VJ47_9PEZI